MAVSTKKTGAVVKACNVCGTSFDPQAQGNDICPGCTLRTRHRTLAAFFAKNGNPTVSGKTLVCHATPAERERLFGDAPNLVNFDIRPLPYLDFTMDVQDMSRIKTGSVDVFVALHVLNHVADDDRALQEIARVLRPGSGTALITVPVRDGGRTQPTAGLTDMYGVDALRDYGVGTYRYYGLDDFRELLGRYFDVAEFSATDPVLGVKDHVFEAKALAAGKRAAPATGKAAAAGDTAAAGARFADLAITTTVNWVEFQAESDAEIVLRGTLKGEQMAVERAALVLLEFGEALDRETLRLGRMNLSESFGPFIYLHAQDASGAFEVDFKVPAPHRLYRVGFRRFASEQAIELQTLEIGVRQP